MLWGIAALVLSQDQSAIDPGPSAGAPTTATAKGASPAVDTYPGSVPPNYVSTDPSRSSQYVTTDPGIDTYCTDIDFEEADVTVSNLGGTDMCCTLVGGKPDGDLMCPTIKEDGSMVRTHAQSATPPSTSVARCPRACTLRLTRPCLARAQGTVTVPRKVYNARQIVEEDYMLFNVCHGSPGATLQGEIKPHEGSTSYIKLSGVQTDKAAPPINMIVKNTTEYFPAWPVLGNCLKDDCRKFERDEADGESLKPAGYLNNGRKSGWDKADDLIQVNLCNKRFLNLKASFVDDNDNDITLMQSTMRFFDIDHGNPENHGPEVMQFKCPGGTFTLYGSEPLTAEDTPDDPNLEFLLYAQAG